ncbi:Chitobiosyldiphosphodolichol beta-mannosyltransferase [Nadsonia fulvescens var. elongata DSM 6958]|uniref:Chitobiosyldiphosphodolichol beta-mannosyltransferase n=1 Tax=Nadsonia fulvescens var. elongata DSM 6958 TaxID=857566 RepID=A0A1E3PQ37_9ASCO|nr:Chitobiosyldiphosphodolichol beta-mannosyltransferase [Nadsonia fulvescens var. elongata DSM 6958]
MHWGWIVFLILLYFLIPACLYLLVPESPTQEDLNRRQHAVVLVLGDLGRSPRMLYHALSLAKGDVRVTLCGYEGSKPLQEIQDHELITIQHIPVIENDNRLPFVLYAIQKVLKQHLILLKLLKKTNRPDFLVIQNPPSIPVLGVVRFFNLFISRRTRVVIDWHNFGYTILGLKLGSKHPLVFIAKYYERIFGRRAWIHLCVSVTMGRVLRTSFGLSGRRIIPLHDRPASAFKPLTEAERKLICKTHPLFNEFDASKDKCIISSTSYTPDENYQTLLDALKLYDQSSKKGLPNILCIVTGKGPLKDEFEQKVKECSFQRVMIKTAWLSMEEYPKIMACADLGISLHESSSGLDLPMKILDMFGCGVPVVAVDFLALFELVKTHKNGIIVTGAPEMATALTSLFSSQGKLDNLKRGAMRESRQGWDANWLEKVGPLFGVGEYRKAGSEEKELSSDDSDYE